MVVQLFIAAEVMLSSENYDTTMHAIYCKCTQKQDCNSYLGIRIGQKYHKLHQTTL
jgi:hypothetical protein